jgi:hypothetical protein
MAITKEVWDSLHKMPDKPKASISPARHYPNGPFSRRLANIALATFIIVETIRTIAMLISY